MMSSPRFPLIFSLVAAALVASPLPAQDQQTKSPVFKSYKPPPEPRALEQIDPVYESWQAFITERKAVSGDPVAQHEMGLRYLLGRGVQADTVKAAYWVSRAAAQNVVPARFNLGILAYNGWGVPWDPFESFRQFLWCAEHDMAEAEFTVGEFYTQNLVVPLDWEKAAYWIGKAANAGLVPAKKTLEEIRKRNPTGNNAVKADSTVAAADSSGRQLVDTSVVPVFLESEDDSASRASEWKVLRSALRASDSEVREALGISRIIDENLDLDTLGMEYIRNAAVGGSPEALAVLGRCYERGIQVEQDPILAAVYYLRGIRMDSPHAGRLLLRLAQEHKFITTLKSRAERGDDDARYCWAGLLSLGFGGLLAQEQAYITDQQALQFLEGAASHGHLPAMIELSLCYYAGRWVSANKDEAIALLHRAATAGSREAEVRLAAMTVRGESGDNDLSRALTTLHEAVHEGSLLAVIALGYCHETGTGVPRNPAEAARLYRDGARRGSQDAYRALRRMLDAIRPSEKEFVITE